jgi:hypothetical protein
MSKAFRWGWHWQTVAVPQAGPARVVVARGGGGGSMSFHAQCDCHFGPVGSNQGAQSIK